MNLSEIVAPASPSGSVVGLAKEGLNPAVPAGATQNGKLCAWCLTPLTGRKYKWCSSACGDSAFAYANPQSEYGLALLLARQEYRCPGCAHDWSPLADSLLGSRGIPKMLAYKAEFNIRLIKALKRHSPKGTRPEVDHIQPVALGGIPLMFDNHQALCQTCHKVKTKIQNSGPRKKRKKDG